MGVHAVMRPLCERVPCRAKSWFRQCANGQDGSRAEPVSSRCFDLWDHIASTCAICLRKAAARQLAAHKASIQDLSGGLTAASAMSHRLQPAKANVEMVAPMVGFV